MMIKWKRYDSEDDSTHPTEPGEYAIMVRGDSETDGPHVFYDYPDYQTYAKAWRNEDGEMELNLMHDEPAEAVFAWFGPLVIPPCDIP